MIEFTKAAGPREKEFAPPLFLCSFQVGRVAYLQIRCHQKALFCVLGSVAALPVAPAAVTGDSRSSAAVLFGNS